MSLYNMICPTSTVADLLWRFLGENGVSMERERDAYPVEVDGELQFAAYTRCGGGNRESYADMWETVRKHPLFIRDEDDDFDCTYATAYFRVPEHIKKPLRDLVDAMPVLLVKPAEKFKAVLANLQGQKPEKPECLNRPEADPATIKAAASAFYKAMTGEQKRKDDEVADMRKMCEEQENHRERPDD